MKFKKDYSRKTYKNPHYTFQVRKEQGKRFKKVSLAASAFLLAVGIIGLISRMDIQTIDVRTTLLPAEEITQLVQTEMEHRRLFILTEHNLFFFNPDRLRQKIVNQYSIDLILIKKKYPHTLSIEVQEQVPEFAWVTNIKGYYLDKNGKVLSEINQNSLESIHNTDYNIVRHKLLNTNLPIIFEPNDSTYQKDKIPTTPEIFQKISKIISLLNQENIKTASHYEFNLNEKTFQVNTPNGWKIYFSMGDEIAPQIQRLKLILEKKSDVGKIVDYIDLRYGDKIFYK